MNSIWVSYRKLNSTLLGKKKIFIFGRSNLGHKLLKKIDCNKKIIFLDNNKALQNKKYYGFNVSSPALLKSFDKKNDYIIIAAEPDTIIKELQKLNLVEGQHFCCTPDIKDWSINQTLKKNSSDIIFSSSDYFSLSEFRSSKSGGGLFIGNVSDAKYEKVAHGQYRQFIKVESYYYAVEFVNHEIHILDKNLKILNKVKININSKDIKLCGITYSSQYKKFYLTDTINDCVYVFDNKFNKFTTIKFFSKNKVDDFSCHVNDIICNGDYLYITYFSKTGKWKNSIFDGGVTKIDIKNPSKKKEIISHLYKPHSPNIFNNQIYVLDSLNGYLINKKKKIARFQGFIRGLDRDEDYFYIGQSEDMYTSQKTIKSIYPTILNAGVYQFDTKNKITKFLPVPDIMNIHDVKIYK